MTVIVVWMSCRRLASFANAVRDAANDPNVTSFSMDIRRYMPGFGRVGAIPVADSADGAKVLLDGDGIAVDNSIDCVASSAPVPENAIVSDVAATNAASTGSNTLICDNCKQREIDDAPKKCSHVKWCSYCDEALWQTNATAADAAATNAVSSGSETLICVNCKQRAIGNAAKKCGFLDWCSFCDVSLWQTNPEVIRATSVDATDADLRTVWFSHSPLSAGAAEELDGSGVIPSAATANDGGGQHPSSSPSDAPRSLALAPQSSGVITISDTSDDGAGNAQSSALAGLAVGGATTAVIDGGHISRKQTQPRRGRSSVRHAYDDVVDAVGTDTAVAKRKRVRADCSSDSGNEYVPPVPRKRNRKVVVSSDDDKHPYEGEAEEAEFDEESDGDEDDEESDGDEDDASDVEDAQYDDDAHTERRRAAVSEACAALRNRRSFKASRNTCPLCADLRVVLSHLLGLE